MGGFGRSAKKMPHQFKALIFDLDGTLVDSEAIVELVMRRWCLEKGIAYEALVDSSRSSRTEDTVRSVAPHLNCKHEADQIEANEREELKNLQEIKGASNFLNQVPRTQWAVSTSSDSTTAIAKLKATGMPLPEVLIGGDQVKHGKPHPESYLSAARELGVSPHDCLAFEDSNTGISSALAAGCCVIAVGTNNYDTTSKAEILGSITNFEELNLVIENCSLLTLDLTNLQNKSQQTNH